jgi:hypothetical protein
VGLYEYLSVAVLTPTDAARCAGDGTTLTHASTETYDDDPELASMSMWSESTIDTRTQTETYDDDPGIGGLGDLTHVGTDRTATPNETYDDNPGLDALGVPAQQLETTVFTKVVGETHDDDGVSLQLDA